jgi:hypothetical protein
MLCVLATSITQGGLTPGLSCKSERVPAPKMNLGGNAVSWTHVFTAPRSPCFSRSAMGRTLIFEAEALAPNLSLPLDSVCLVGFPEELCPVPYMDDFAVHQELSTKLKDRLVP